MGAFKTLSRHFFVAPLLGFCFHVHFHRRRVEAAKLNRKEMCCFSRTSSPHLETSRSPQFIELTSMCARVRVCVALERFSSSPCVAPLPQHEGSGNLSECLENRVLSTFCCAGCYPFFLVVRVECCQLVKLLSIFTAWEGMPCFAAARQAGFPSRGGGVMFLASHLHAIKMHSTDPPALSRLCLVSPQHNRQQKKKG